MKIYGEVTERESKVLKVLGTNKSLKDLVGVSFHLIGAVDTEEVKIAEDGSEYTTNYVKLATLDGESLTVKFTQTVVMSQIAEIFNNELNDMLYTLEYINSSNGNKYLSIGLA